MIKQILFSQFQVVLIIGFLGNIAMAEEKSQNIIIFYKPFSVETFIDVTIDSIEQQANCIFEFDRTSHKAKRLTQIMNQVGKGPFNYKKVRYKITGLFPDDIFVDQAGGVLRGNDDNFGLNYKMHYKLAILLDDWAMANGCKTNHMKRNGERIDPTLEDLRLNGKEVVDR